MPAPRRPERIPPPADTPQAAAYRWVVDDASSGVATGEPSDGPLPGATANRDRVIRIGDTVRRPLAPCHRATHALLDHLAAAGFDGVPRVLRVDRDAGTETLSYIAGRAAIPPMPAEVLTDAALVSLAGLLRRYHRAAASFTAGGHRWQRPVPTGFVTGLIAHNDVHPGNVVFRGERAVGLIDFDLAGPACAAWDLAAAARSWAPLCDERDITDARRGRGIERFRLLLDAYGLDRAGRLAVAEAILPNHDWTYAIVTDAVAAGHPGFTDHWNRIAAEVHRERRWCLAHHAALLAAAR